MREMDKFVHAMESFWSWNGKSQTYRGRAKAVFATTQAGFVINTGKWGFDSYHGGRVMRQMSANRQMCLRGIEDDYVGWKR